MTMRLLEMLLPCLAWMAVQPGHALDGKSNWRCFTWTVWKKRTIFLIPAKLLHSESTDVCHFFSTVCRTISRRWVLNEVSILGLLGLLFAFTLWTCELLSVTQNKVLNLPGCYFWKSYCAFHTHFICDFQLVITDESKSTLALKKLAWAVKHRCSSCCG